MSRLPDARRWRLEGSWWRRDPLDDLTPGWGVGKESLCLGARPSPRGAHAGGRFGGGVVRGTPLRQDLPTFTIRPSSTDFS